MPTGAMPTFVGIREYIFGGIASAAGKSKLAKNAVTFGTADHATVLSNEVVDFLGRYLNNLFGVVMNGGSTFEQYLENFTDLANSIVMLTDTNNKQQSVLWDLHKENANLNKKVETPEAGGGRHHSTRSNSEFPGYGPNKFWVWGSYCLYHGSGVGKHHASSNCHEK